jgi:preprotein translocase subunit YajC
MTILIMDIIYIVAISGIVGTLYMIEAQIKSIKVMMEEHIKFDERKAMQCELEKKNSKNSEKTT